MLLMSEKERRESIRTLISRNNALLENCTFEGIIDNHPQIRSVLIQFLAEVDLNQAERKSSPLTPDRSMKLLDMIYNITTPDKSISQEDAIKATHYLLDPKQEFPFSTEKIQAMRSQIIANANAAGIDVQKYVKYALISALKESQNGSLQHLNPDLRYTFGVSLFGCLLFVRKSDLEASARAMEYDLEQLMLELSKGLNKP